MKFALKIVLKFMSFFKFNLKFSFNNLKNAYLSLRKIFLIKSNLLIVISIFLFLLSILLPAYLKRKEINLPIILNYDMPAIIEKKHLKLGTVTGPYEDIFVNAIMPLLAVTGYTVELVHYNNYIDPNFALARKEIDLNLFQHYLYLNNFKFENDLALSAIEEVPTVPMGIFSLKYKSLDEFKNNIENNITVSIPDDVTNRARALIILENAGLITLDSSINKEKASIIDVINNFYNIKFDLIKPVKLVNSLASYDLSVITGNYASNSGFNPSKALYNEEFTYNYLNVIAVRTEDLDKQFVRDIIHAIHSSKYREILTKSRGKYSEFYFPRNFFDSF